MRFLFSFSPLHTTDKRQKAKDQRPKTIDNGQSWLFLLISKRPIDWLRMTSFTQLFSFTWDWKETKTTGHGQCLAYYNHRSERMATVWSIACHWLTPRDETRQENHLLSCCTSPDRSILPSEIIPRHAKTSSENNKSPTNGSKRFEKVRKRNRKGWTRSSWLLFDFKFVLAPMGAEHWSMSTRAPHSRFLPLVNLFIDFDFHLLIDLLIDFLSKWIRLRLMRFLRVPPASSFSPPKTGRGGRGVGRGGNNQGMILKCMPHPSTVLRQTIDPSVA